MAYAQRFGVVSRRQRYLADRFSEAVFEVPRQLLLSTRATRVAV